MIFIFDKIFAFVGLVVSLPILIVISIVGFFDTGSPLFIQKRLGKNKKPFSLVKFRTMRVGTSSVASHLAPIGNVTKFGRFLRITKIDELPQLINVLKGDMSLVGPRPNLDNQIELIEAREMNNVYSELPGITGLAQIRNIDMSTPMLLAETDKEMLINLDIKCYLKIILYTIIGKGAGDAARK